MKSILDVPATLERLESLSVTVVGYRTTTFPGFYVADSGSTLDWSVADPAQAAAVFAARRALAPGAVVVANPLPVDEQLDPALHDRVIADALAAAEPAGVRGKDVTPFVLDHLHRASEGATLAVNVRLVLRNAELAGQIAAALRARLAALTVVVVGDVATDVVVVLAGDPAPGSDRPASISTRGGGAGANVAAHLARLGIPVELAGCIGDDAAGAGLAAELTAAGVRLALRTVPGVRDRDDRQPGRAGRAAQHARRPRGQPRTGGRRRARPRAGRAPAPVRLHAAGPAARGPPGSRALAGGAAAGCTISVDPASTGPLARYGVDRWLADTRGRDAAAAQRRRGPAADRVRRTPRTPRGPWRAGIRSWRSAWVPDGALWASGDVLVHRPAAPDDRRRHHRRRATRSRRGCWRPGSGRPAVDPAAALDAGLARAAAVVRQPGAR